MSRPCMWAFGSGASATRAYLFPARQVTFGGASNESGSCFGSMARIEILLIVFGDSWPEAKTGQPRPNASRVATINEILRVMRSRDLALRLCSALSDSSPGTVVRNTFMLYLRARTNQPLSQYSSHNR